MILLPYTFQCKELLFVLGQMFPPPDLSEPGTPTEAAAQLANTISRNVIVVDNHELLVELDEPVEALSIARQLELRAERCIVSPLAFDLIRESGEPARASLAWLRQRIIVRDDARSVVKLHRIINRGLPDDVDQIPPGPGIYLWILDPVDRVLFLDREQTIGRGAAADVRLDDIEASGIHAAFTRVRGDWAIQDRGSTTGTFIDDSRCSSRCLVPGMTIRIGKTRIAVLSVR